MSDPAKALAALDDETVRCPFPHYAALRDQAPVVWSDELGAFLVTGDEEAQAVLRDPDAFSSRNAAGPLSAERLGPILEAAGDLVPELLEIAGNANPGLLLADPPEHTRVRSLVNRAFTPKRVQLLEPFIEQLANELVDRFIERGSVDFIDEFAVPLPITVIARILGIPDDELGDMKRWSKDLVVLVGNHGDTAREDVAAFLAADRQFKSCIGALIDARRAEPVDDLVGVLAATEVDGELIDRAVLLDVLRQFVTAGHDTTTALLAAGMQALAEDPTLAAAVQADPDRIPAFVEEVLRLDAPLQGLYRTTTGPTTLSGVDLPADRQVLVLYAAGNRDPRAHAEPDSIVLDREPPTRHLSFGQGIHFCVGAPLARAEGRIAFRVLAERFLPLEPVIDGAVGYQRSLLLRGRSALSLRFNP
ncbi:MAG: cytochrome P450 [Actinomycetota bacterium]|nr:cytochrome P450 [Actinomycetota bacterium]